MSDREFITICTEKKLTDKKTLRHEKEYNVCDKENCEFWVSVKNTNRFTCSKNKMGLSE